LSRASAKPAQDGRVSAELPVLGAVANELSAAGSQRRPWLERRLRALPVRWRIMSIAVLNSALALVLLILVWDGAAGLGSAWGELRQVRQSERLLMTLDSEAGRLQSLIHRYFTQPNPAVLDEIVKRRDALMRQLQAQGLAEPSVAASAQELISITERFLQGFEDLRAVRASLSGIYEGDILEPAKDMAGLYAILDSTTQSADTLIRPSLGKSREAYNAMLLAANAYYLTLSEERGQEAKRYAETIERTAPVIIGLAETELQRNALGALRDRAAAVRRGLDLLAEQVARQTRLLSEAIDSNAGAMSAATDRLKAGTAQRERAAQDRFDRALSAVSAKVAIVAAGFVLVVVLIGIGVSRSISEPLHEMLDAMRAIIEGRYERPVRGLDARDEAGDIARAVELFRENAVARRRAEDELRLAKERAEAALLELRDTQTSLVEAEKLAALGSLVAGVAHEVNNPVGISLTVASTLARRSEAFAAETEAGQVRRSRLAEFIEGNREAANQLVANLLRAGELIQAFKQVAVDRSHPDRRRFDLRQSTEQILSSLRPGLKGTRIQVIVDMPEGVVLDSYPGPFGQVLTNLFLNAVNHAFPDGREGTITIVGRTSGDANVHLVFRDDGVGMTETVQRRAFDPFFTTRRGEGGTGLGLHIVYNLVTGRLGGRIVLSSTPDGGTTFRISMPRVAPAEETQTAGSPAPAEV
jgi:signal transduction histidine kinase